MKHLIELLKQGIKEACDEAIDAINHEKQEINQTISDLTVRQRDEDRKRKQMAEDRYKSVMEQLTDQTEEEPQMYIDTFGIETDRSDSNSSANLPSLSEDGEFIKVSGEVFSTYRLTAGKKDRLEQIECYNQFYANYPDLSHTLTPKRVVYIFDVDHFLKVFSEEIRHISSCITYREAAWKVSQARAVMEESYRVLVRLIDEVLSAYNPSLQVLPNPPNVQPPTRIRVQYRDGVQRIVDLRHVHRKADQLYCNQLEVKFLGYLAEELHVIFPLPIFDVLNPHILKLMRQDLKQNQHDRAFEHWRSCKIRIQDLGENYEKDLNDQLETWLENNRECE